MSNNNTGVQEGRFDPIADTFIAIIVDNFLDAERLFLTKEGTR